MAMMKEDEGRLTPKTWRVPVNLDSSGRTATNHSHSVRVVLRKKRGRENALLH